MKRLAILGSTGSIGTQALEVLACGAGDHRVVLLSGGNNHALLLEQARRWMPEAVVCHSPEGASVLKQALKGSKTRVHAGNGAIASLLEELRPDLCLAAIVGYAGLASTLACARLGINVALANKESLVAGGELVMSQARKTGAAIIPVDSEHSALFQCLVGEEAPSVRKIILTASGGPFRGRKRADLAKIGPEQALKHPNWSMGAKITIDSATLMNKGLEVIEAHWLFDLPGERIDVVVHPQSIVHSMVEFVDGSIKAQLGVPDMKVPIAYALNYPERKPTPFAVPDWRTLKRLDFEEPDRTTFGNLDLAYKALDMGGNAPCVLNAANEVHVQQFLEGKISFLDISERNATVLARASHIAHPDYQALMDSDAEARRLAV